MNAQARPSIVSVTDESLVLANQLRQRFENYNAEFARITAASPPAPAASVRREMAALTVRRVWQARNGAPTVRREVARPTLRRVC